MKAILSIIATLFCLNLAGQTTIVPVQYFDSLFSKERVYYFDKKEKEFFGCGMNLEGLKLNLHFKLIELDQLRKTIRIVGYAYMNVSGSDTIGIGNLKVFLAKPRKKQLKKVSVVAYLESDSPSSSVIKWDPKTGYFDIVFRYPQEKYLYFDSGSPFCMREHQLSKLLNRYVH